MNINELNFNKKEQPVAQKEVTEEEKKDNSFFCFKLAVEKKGRIETFLGFLFMLIGFGVTLAVVVLLSLRFVEKLF